MKKILSFVTFSLMLSIMSVTSANASETGETVGGFAVVNPETGVVHGVITGSIEYFGGNNRTMDSEYMGCPAGCLIIQQSTADQNGNVAGIFTQENSNQVVTHISEQNVFQITENNAVQNQVVTEFASNTLSIETDVNILRSLRVHEFGVIDFNNPNIVEIIPSDNISVTISATTKEFICTESNFLCSSIKNDSSNTLVDESVYFDQRSTIVEIETKIITEAKNKIREQLSLILNMLEKWIVN